MKLAKLAWATMAAAALCAAQPAAGETVVCWATSEPFRLDTREGPFESTGTETIAYSTLWHTNATVAIYQDGVELGDAAGLVGESNYVWRVTANGTYTLRHVADGNVAGAETATFAVTGLEPDPSADLKATLAWKYAKNANGWYCAQLAITWKPAYADGISNMRLLFADRFEDDEETLAAYLVDPATVIDPLDNMEECLDGEYRAVPIDLAPFASLKAGARAVVGVSDETLKSSLASVPKGEQTICLRVAKRNLAALEDASAMLAWEAGGMMYYLPLKPTLAPPAPSIYTVRFSANNGKGTMEEQTMVSGEAAKLSANAFTRKGWVFAGWATRADGPVAYANKKAVKDLCAAGKSITLYAVWAKPTYKVAFYANDGTKTSVSQGFKYGTAQALKANTFKRKGYAFQGWAKKKDGKVAYKNKQQVKNLTTTGATVKLYAVWKKK